jgi:prepilin-type N-terminal cleavage/methylation domain-containing protein
MSRQRRGFTLIEMMIGVVVGSIIVLAAVAFAGQEARTLATSNQVLELGQVGRVALGMIADDVTNAGVGVGYRADGTFVGINTTGVVNGAADDIELAGGAFNTRNRAINVAGVATTTDDLVVSVADGATATIVGAPTGSLAGANVTVCAPGPNDLQFSTGDRVIARDAFGLAAASYMLTNVATPSPCPADVQCVGSGECVDLAVGVDAYQWTSDATADNAGFMRGQLIGNFRQVVWYVDPTRSGRLRRYTVDPTVPPGGACAAFACGAIVAEGVESLQFRVRAFATPGGWQDVTAAAVQTNNPLRVDLELVIRARTEDSSNKLHDPARLLLESRAGAPVCLPAACGTQTLVRREVYRTSVEVKNSGFMRLTAGGAS